MSFYLGDATDLIDLTDGGLTLDPSLGPQFNPLSSGPSFADYSVSAPQIPSNINLLNAPGATQVTLPDSSPSIFVGPPPSASAISQATGSPFNLLDYAASVSPPPVKPQANPGITVPLPSLFTSAIPLPSATPPPAQPAGAKNSLEKWLSSSTVVHGVSNSWIALGGGALLIMMMSKHRRRR